MKRFLSNSLLILLSLLLILATFGIWQLQDRHPDISFQTRNIHSYGSIEVGAAAVSITPEFETWTDVNNNARYDEGIDTYQDENGNGRFDAAWLAGFHSKRAATKVHDPLLAAALIIKVGAKKIGIISLDLIGLGNDICWEIRKKIKARTNIDHTYIVSTHNHEGPDVIGMWGNSRWQSGTKRDYIKKVIDQSVNAMQLARESLQPARITLAQDSISSKSLFVDTRPPNIIDPTINVLQATSIRDDNVIATMVNWSNHVETLWDQNLEISADFVHYLRKGISDGVFNDSINVVPAQGGITLFLPGSVGGLMSTIPELSIRHPLSQSIYSNPSFLKAEAQGYALAKIAYQALQSSREEHSSFFYSALKSYQQIIPLTLDNWQFGMGAYLGILDRGLTGWKEVRSEIGYWELGNASFMHLPGELYPELAIGGLEEPKGADFPNLSLEIPPLKSAMTTDYQWIVGLSNDMIGYIIPRSQWDVNPPFTYEQEKAPYGEVMSLGPETAPKLHAALLSLMAQAQAETQ